ncbi:MAG: alpha/beta hydrolase fold domain-containing protein [Aliarcobacter sp.]
MRYFIAGMLLAIFLSSFSQAGSKTNEIEFSSNPQIEVRGDVSFLEPSRAEKLDLYLPKNRKAGEKSPAVLLIHGGGWKEGDKRQAREIEFGMTLAKNGFVAASINYALRSDGKFPLNLQDCKNGIRYLRANADELGIDPDHISVMGGSAGGHLALLVAYTADVSNFAPSQPFPRVSDKVSCVVDFYGVSNLATRKETDPNGKPLKIEPLDSTTQSIFGSTPQDWKKASPVTHVKRDVPPTLILHGKKDTTVDSDQSQELADALKKAGATYEIIWLQNAPHSFSFQYAVPKSKKPLEKDIGPAVLSFLKKYQNK